MTPDDRMLLTLIEGDLLHVDGRLQFMEAAGDFQDDAAELRCQVGLMLDAVRTMKASTR